MQNVLSLVLLGVLVTYLQFYFGVLISGKVAFEERPCKTIDNKFVNFLLNLKLDSNISTEPLTYSSYDLPSYIS